jgi:hypothetical protein
MPPAEKPTEKKYVERIKKMRNLYSTLNDRQVLRRGGTK